VRHTVARRIAQLTAFALNEIVQQRHRQFVERVRLIDVISENLTELVTRLNRHARVVSARYAPDHLRPSLTHLANLSILVRLDRDDERVSLVEHVELPRTTKVSIRFDWRL
jgi:hypothetical protein